MYEFLYDYVKLKYRKKRKNTDSFIVHVKAGDICEDVANDVEKRFDTSNYELERPLPKGKNQKCYRLSKGRIKWKNIEKTWEIKSTNI